MGFLSKNESGTPSDAACLLSKNKVNFAEMLHCEQKGSTTDNSRATMASAEMLTGCVLGEHLACLRNNTQGCSYSDSRKGLTSEWGKTLRSRVLVRRTCFLVLPNGSNVSVFNLQTCFKLFYPTLLSACSCRYY